MSVGMRCSNVHRRAVEVVARREAGLEHHHGRARLGQQHPVKLDAHAARGAQRVDAGVGVSRVDEDLLVLLEPGVECVPVEASGAGETLERVLGVDAYRGRPLLVPGEQAMPQSGAAAQVLRPLLVDQHRRVDVGERDVVLRVVGPLPHVEGARRVEHELPGEEGPDPPRHRLDVVDSDDHPGVVVHHSASNRDASAQLGARDAQEETRRSPEMGGAPRARGILRCREAPRRRPVERQDRQPQGGGEGDAEPCPASRRRASVPSEKVNTRRRSRTKLRAR